MVVKKIDKALQITTAMLQKQAQLHESGLRMMHNRNLADMLSLPFELKQILVEEWEVITQCKMLHNVPCKISVREALRRFLDSKLEPLRVERSKGNVSENRQGKAWIDMVEGIAVFFDEALPVNLLFAEERGQYSLLHSQILAQRQNSVASNLEHKCAHQSLDPHVANTQTASSKSSRVIHSSSDIKAPPQNWLPERMSDIYGCEHLVRLFVRLPSVVLESSTITEMESRRIFSKIGDLVQFLVQNKSSLFQASFRKPSVGELHKAGRKREIRATSTVDTVPMSSPNWANNGDDNGLYFAKSCNPSNNGAKKCFDATHNKICYHEVDQVSLNQLGQYVIFPSRWWHRGYYNITSEFEYYTAQLFCTGAKDSESWAGHTRAKNKEMKQGRLHNQDVISVSQDIDDNWNTTYAASKYPPSKAFDGEAIDRGANRHLTEDSFRRIPEMNALVEKFESQNRELRVNSVWIIKKNKDNKGFQKWHRDFYLETGAGIITTIVVNVGVY